MSLSKASMKTRIQTDLLGFIEDMSNMDTPDLATAAANLGAFAEGFDEIVVHSLLDLLQQLFVR